VQNASSCSNPLVTIKSINNARASVFVFNLLCLLQQLSFRRNKAMDDEHATPQLSHFNALRRTSSQGPPSLQSLCVEAVTANVAKPGLLNSAQMARLHTELLLEVRIIRCKYNCLISIFRFSNKQLHTISSMTTIATYSCMNKPHFSILQALEYQFLMLPF